MRVIQPLLKVLMKLLSAGVGEGDRADERVMLIKRRQAKQRRK